MYYIINLCNIYLLQLMTNLDQRMTSLCQLETIYQGYQLFFSGGGGLGVESKIKWLSFIRGTQKKIFEKKNVSIQW